MTRISKIVAVIQLLFGSVSIAGSLYFLWLANSPEMRNSRDADVAIRGLYIAAEIFLPLGLLVLVGGVAMWKNKRWGWWLAMITDASLLLVFVYSLIDNGLKRADAEDIAVTVLSIIPVILLLLPAVRRSYWHKGPAISEHIPAPTE